MTTLESCLEDYYRQQIERLENERTRLENAVARKNWQIDDLLERLEPAPKSEPEKPEMVRVLDCRSKVWWTGGVYKSGGVTSDIAKASLYSREELRELRLNPELYELRPVVEKPKRMRVVVELPKYQPRKPEIGETVMLYLDHISAHELGQDAWVGTVVAVEEGGSR